MAGGLSKLRLTRSAHEDDRIVLKFVHMEAQFLNRSSSNPSPVRIRLGDPPAPHCLHFTFVMAYSSHGSVNKDFAWFECGYR